MECFYRRARPTKAAAKPATGVRPGAAPVVLPEAAAEPLAKPEWAAVFWVRVAVDEDAAAGVVVESPEAAVEEDAGNLWVDPKVSHDEPHSMRLTGGNAYAFAALHQLVCCCWAGAAAGSAGQLL